MSYPKIIISQQSTTSLTQLKKLQEEGVYAIELRADGFKDKNRLKILKSEIKKIKDTGLKSLLTIRHPREGGIYKLSLNERINTFIELGSQVDIIDLELQFINEYAAILNQIKKHSKIIVSKHYFNHTPSLNKLNDLLVKAKKLNPDFFKLATNLNTPKSLKTITQFLINNSLNIKLITVGMGNYGPLSRIYLPALESHFVYTFIQKATAPGQIRYSNLKNIYHQHYPKEL